MSVTLTRVWLLTLASAGCLDPLDTPTAYESEPYLCGSDSQGAWTEQLEACRDAYEKDRSCAGLFSFRGQLEGTPLKVTSEISFANFENSVVFKLRFEPL